MFSLKQPVGTNYRVDPQDLINTKTALNQLGYYNVPPHRGIDDWTDDAMFEGIRNFQKDNGLKVDAFMRPGGPTEFALQARLEEGSTKPETPGSNMPVIVPYPIDPRMEKTELPPRTTSGPYRDRHGNIILDGTNPNTGRPIRPPKGPY